MYHWNIYVPKQDDAQQLPWCPSRSSQWTGTGTMSEAEAHLSTSDVLITFYCKSGICPSLALSNKNPQNEKTAAPLMLYF